MPVPPRTIGQVIQMLRAEYPNIKVSKIRFLERKGLISPERDQPSGYRRYTQKDIDRLRYILKMQRDAYLPLKVIRECLDQIDAGANPEDVMPTEPPPPPPEPSTAAPPPPPVTRQTKPKRAQRMSRREILQMSGISESLFIELERAGMIRPRHGTGRYGREALVLAVAARRLAPYGFGIHQLKLIQQAAMQEAGMIEQTLTPYSRHRDTPAEVLNEVVQMVMHAHSSILHTETRR